MPQPIPGSNPNTQNRKASEMNPRRQFGKFSDRVIPPFLVLFAFISRLVFELENDPFHTAMQMMPKRQSSGTGAGNDATTKPASSQSPKPAETGAATPVVCIAAQGWPFEKKPRGAGCEQSQEIDGHDTRALESTRTPPNGKVSPFKPDLI